MSRAAELIRGIESIGGEIWVEGEELVIRPGEAAMPVLEELREYKHEVIALLLSRTADPVDDPLAGEWMLERCTYVDRWWGGIGALYLSLARWLAERGRPVPASRLAFVTALQREGFQVNDGLVYGLVLKSDVKAYLHFQEDENNDYSLRVPAKSSALLERSVEN